MAISVDQFPNIPLQEYSDIRSNLRSGDILLCSGSSVMSNIIQKATASVWSHVGFIIKLDDIGRIMVLESVESIGVRTVTLSSYVKNYNASGSGYPGKILIARHNQFRASTINNLSQYAVDLFGYPYSNKDILRIAARIGMKEFGFDKNDSLITPDHAYICSEYAYECYKSVGIIINYDKNGYIAPCDFAIDPDIEPIANLKISID